MRAMVAVEYPDGSVRVTVLPALVDLQWDTTMQDTVAFYDRPRYVLPSPAVTTITLRGVGVVQHYDQAPAWFAPDEQPLPDDAALPAPPRALEA